MQIGLYRKAIAVFLTSLVGVVAQFVPGISDHVGAEFISVASALLATIFAVFVSDRFKGVPVNEAAAVFIDALSDGRIDFDKGHILEKDPENVVSLLAVKPASEE